LRFPVSQAITGVQYATISYCNFVNIDNFKNNKMAKRKENA
jgi:hypothetical protein